MVLPSDARDLVAAEGCVGRVEVVAVRPHPARLDRASHAVRLGDVARPDAGTEPVHRVVRDAQRLGLVLERRHGEHGAEDLLLEDPHVVAALEDGRLEVVAALQLAAEVRRLPADQELGTLVAADLHVALDLLELRGRDLRADLRRRVEWMTLLDRGDPLEAARHERLVDRLLDQCPRRAGADLALVEGVEHQPFDRLVEELVVGRHHVGEEDVRRLAAQLGRRRDDVLGGVLHDQPPGHRLAGERDLRDPLARRERLADLAAGAVDDVDHARRAGSPPAPPSASGSTTASGSPA